MSDDKLEAMKTLALCVKDREARVVSQSASCQELCGDQCGQICQKGCMTLLRRGADQSIALGMQSFPAQTVGDETVDIVVINDGQSLITIMLSLEGDVKAQTERFASFGLSKREAEIATLVLRGKTNWQIAGTLHIALSTVKKHLYSIYQKLPDHEITKRRSKEAAPRTQDKL